MNTVHMISYTTMHKVNTRTSSFLKYCRTRIWITEEAKPNVIIQVTWSRLEIAALQWPSVGAVTAIARLFPKTESQVPDATCNVWTETDSSPGLPSEGVQRKQSCGAAHSTSLVLDRSECLTWRWCFSHREEYKYTLTRCWVFLWAGPEDLEKTKLLVPVRIRTSDRPAHILVPTSTALCGLYCNTNLTLVGSLMVPPLIYLIKTYLFSYLLTYIFT